MNKKSGTAKEIKTGIAEQSIPKLNAAWHKAHPMPKNPSVEQRIEWHLEHQKHCRCRKISGKLAAEMKKRGITF